MKLNVGCGQDVRQGYVNVDFRADLPGIMLADLSILPWPFSDSTADEIMMLDFLEHFPYAKTDEIIVECNRKDGEDVKRVLSESMLEAAYKYLPDIFVEAEAEIAESWADKK